MLATGVTQGPTKIGTTTLTGPAFPDCFLVSQDTGTNDFVTVLGGTSAQSCLGLDTNGNDIAVVGSNAGTMTGAGADLSTTGGDDAFVAIFEAGGKPKWRAGFGSTARDGAISVAISQSLVVAVGEYGGSFSHTKPLAWKGDQDAFVVAFDLAGTPLWELAIGTEGSDRAERVAIASDGRVFVSGYLNNLGKGTVQLNLPGVSESINARDAFVVELSNTGAILSFALFGGKGQQGVSGLVLSNDTVVDDVLVTGTFAEELWVNGKLLEQGQPTTASFGGHGFLARFTP
jgi:hypothetical protein